MIGHDALMHRDTRPGDALHVGHWRAAVDVRLVIDALLEDRENALRRRMTRHAGGYSGLGDRHAAGIERELLLFDRDDDVQRSRRQLFWCGSLFEELPRFLLVDGAPVDRPYTPLRLHDVARRRPKEPAWIHLIRGRR